MRTMFGQRPLLRSRVILHTERQTDRQTDRQTERPIALLHQSWQATNNSYHDNWDISPILFT